MKHNKKKKQVVNKNYIFFGNKKGSSADFFYRGSDFYTFVYSKNFDDAYFPCTAKQTRVSIESFS